MTLRKDGWVAKICFRYSNLPFYQQKFHLCGLLPRFIFAFFIVWPGIFLAWLILGWLVLIFGGRPSLQFAKVDRFGQEQFCWPFKIWSERYHEIVITGLFIALIFAAVSLLIYGLVKHIIIPGSDNAVHIVRNDLGEWLLILLFGIILFFVMRRIIKSDIPRFLGKAIVAFWKKICPEITFN